MTGRFLILSLQASSSFMFILSAFLGTKFERYEEFIIFAKDAAFRQSFSLGLQELRLCTLP